MKKLKVTLTVEVTLDADRPTVTHYLATGEMLDAVKFSVERAEVRAQRILDQHAKSLGAVVGADYCSVAEREVETKTESYRRRVRQFKGDLVDESRAGIGDDEI